MNKTCLIIHYMLCNVKDSRVPTILLHNPAHIATANKHSTTQVCALTCFTQFVFTHCSSNCMFLGHWSSRQTFAISEQKAVLSKNVRTLFEYFLENHSSSSSPGCKWPKIYEKWWHSTEPAKKSHGSSCLKLYAVILRADTKVIANQYSNASRSTGCSKREGRSDLQESWYFYKEMNGKESWSYSDASGWAYIHLALNAQSWMWRTHIPKKFIIME